MGTAFTNALSEVWTQIGSVVTTISNTSLLLIPVALAFAGGAISLAKSLMGTKRRRR